ncbi:MAG: hypothetical protein N2C14_03700 [Planctomycetales bacterium]
MAENQDPLSKNQDPLSKNEDPASHRCPQCDGDVSGKIPAGQPSACPHCGAMVPASVAHETPGDETTTDGEHAEDFAESDFPTASPKTPDAKPLDSDGEFRFCLRCQEPLQSVHPRCLRCSLPFDPEDPATFRNSPTFLRWQFWFPGFCLSTVVGVMIYALLKSASQEMGVAMFLAVPVSFGAILGYATDTRIWWALFLGITGVAGVAFTLIAMNVAGLFCGLTLGLFFLGPAMFGVVLGWLLRFTLKGSTWTQRPFLPIVLFILFPCGLQVVESCVGHAPTVATVQTSADFDVRADAAWNSIQFYEEVEHEPTWLLRWALPRPLRVEGAKEKVGDVARCVYDRGFLTKQITEADPGRLLRFDVIEQKVHFEHDVKLLDGSFEITPLPGGRSRVTLSTRYRRMIHPRWLWEPCEREVIHSLHAHVLQGMREFSTQGQDNGPDFRYREPGSNELIVTRRHVARDRVVRESAPPEGSRRHD